MTTSEADSVRSDASGGAPALPGPSRTALRDNLESIAMAVLLVLIVRQLVVEAFKIPTGSMAPTLLGVHKEVRCTNCGWTFTVGYNKLTPEEKVWCPNCDYRWHGASPCWYPEDANGPSDKEDILFRQPEWLWNHGRTAGSGRTIEGMDAANRVNRWGSRIFVNKFIYKFRTPRRWEVVVFLYPFYGAECKKCGWRGEISTRGPIQCPDCKSERISILDQKNYIKRLVGLPGETIKIRNGDLYVNGKIARKPPGIQERMWMPAFDSAFVPRQELERTWDFGSTTARWKRNRSDGSLTADALDSDQPVTVAFGRPVLDLCAYNGTHISSLMALDAAEGEEVGDCRMELSLKVEQCGKAAKCGVGMEITEDDHSFVLFVPAAQGGKAVLSDNGSVVAENKDAALRRGRSARIVLENHDDLVVAELDGKAIMQHAYKGNPKPAAPHKRLAFGAAGAKVLFDRVRIQRDVYYLPGREDEYKLGKDSYFVLGDNSPESSDSRAWNDVPADNLLGEAFAIFWPVHDIGLLSVGSR